MGRPPQVRQGELQPVEEILKMEKGKEEMDRKRQMEKEGEEEEEEESRSPSVSRRQSQPSTLLLRRRGP